MQTRIAQSAEQEMYLLTAEQFQYYWPQIKECCEQVPQLLRYYSLEDIFERTIKGEMSFWTLGRGKIEAIIATQILVFPQVKVFQIFGAYGEGLLDFLERACDVFDQIAAINGCEDIQVVGRPGWRKALREFQTEFETVVLTRRVNKPREM